MAPNAIILAAGAGSRLRPVAPVKPLVEVGGRSLIGHALDALAAAGIQETVIVVGHEGEAIRSGLVGERMPLRFVDNPRWADTPNGVSLLAARASVQPGSLLLMADHLLSAALVSRLTESAPAPLTLAVDRRLGHPWVDEADVTRVRTRHGRIEAIGKGLLSYDCYDTGLFRIGPELVAALDGLKAPSLSEGVALLAGRGEALVADIGDAPWLDVDDARALALARAEWARWERA